MTELRASEWMDDWFVLTEYRSAQPEGDAEQWREVINVLKAGAGSVRHRRIAAWWDGSVVAMDSPRNSIVEDGECRLTAGEVAAFIEQAESVLDEAQQVVADGAGI